MKKLLIIFVAILFVAGLSSCSDVKAESGEQIKEEVQNSVSGEQQNISESIEFQQEDKPNPIGISYYEAQEQGGFFILKTDESFVPLCEEIVPLDYTKMDNIFMLSCKNDDFLPLNENEKLVIFSSDIIEDVYYFIPVIEEGYTIPFTFSESYKIESMDFKWTGADYDSYQADDMIARFGDYKDDCRIAFDTANGMQPKEFYNEQTVQLHDYCSGGITYGCSYKSIFVSDKCADRVSIEFYSGSQYFEETFNADIACYFVDGCRKNKNGKTYYSGTAITPEFTKEGYVILDTSSLENGKYVIANINERVIFEISR